MAEIKSITSIDGVKISYQIAKVKGARQTLVLLHGLGGEAGAWGEVVRHLNSAGYDAVAIDLRGHGGSADLPKLSDYSFNRLAEDVKEVLVEENLDSCVLVGHCYGGMVALVFAGTYGGMLEGLVLIDTSYRSPLLNASHVNRDFLVKVLKSVTSQSPDGDWSMKRLTDDIRRTSIYNYLRSFQSSLVYRSGSLDRISVPTLIIHGDEDSVIPTKTADQMHKMIIGSELSILKSANHIVVLNDPVVLFEAIDSFVRSLSSAG